MLSGKEFLETLRDGRRVYIGSERVDDVTTHPAFRNAAQSFAMIYDRKLAPENRELMVCEEDGEEFSTYYLKPRSREDLERRLTQFVGETARVPLAAAAFASADRSALRALAEASQQGAEQGLNNQIPETVALCGLAYDEGACGASAFGAGFGGSVWAMVPAGEADDFGAAWIERYREAFPHRDKAEWFSASPGPAAVEVA